MLNIFINFKSTTHSINYCYSPASNHLNQYLIPSKYDLTLLKFDLNPHLPVLSICENIQLIHKQNIALFQFKSYK